MKIIFIILFAVTPYFAQSCPIENGWKGIKIFQTTRLEVEKVLGVPSEEINAVETSYRTKEELIHFVYSHSPCSNAGDGRFTVPKDTVIGFRIMLGFLEYEKKLSDFKWNSDLYEKWEDTHQLWHVHYHNPKDGIRIIVVKVRSEPERVQSISFEPSKEQTAKFACK